MDIKDLKVKGVYGYIEDNQLKPCELISIDENNQQVTIGTSAFIYEEGKQGYKIFVGKEDQITIPIFLLLEYTQSPS